MSSETLEKLKSAAGDVVANLLYTAVFDTANEAIAGGADQAKTLEAADAVINRYVEGGVKIRKKPAPRAKAAAKTPAKEKQVDAVTAASRKVKSLSSNITWVVHPEDSSFSYTPDVRLPSGYPVRENATQKVVMVATEDSTVPLTVKDARMAMSYGLQIDTSQIKP
jgi:hypothetical protein